MEFKRVSESIVIISGWGVKVRIRLEYEKDGGLRYSSTLDLQKIWERSFRRAKIKMAYTQGFHPHPKMQIALPLPLGFLSQVEIIDIWIEDDLKLDAIKNRFSGALPHGLRIKSIRIIENSEKSLVDQIQSVSYTIKIKDSHLILDELQNKIVNFLQKDSILRTRRKRSYDLRPLVNSLILISEKKSGDLILLNLAAESGKTGRPDEAVSYTHLTLPTTPYV